MIGLLRFFSPRLAARWELWRKQVKTASAAYTNARDIAEVFGCKGMAEQLECRPDFIVIAHRYAEGFHKPVRRDVFRGVLDGLTAHAEGEGKQ